MTTSALSMEDPLAKRIIAWMDERFPFANALLFFILYLTSAAVVRAASDEPVSVSFMDLISCFATWALFLVIRIFDEHKDYELDVKNHPDRVLQSGLITLTHLRIFGAAAVIVQVFWSFYLDGFSFGPVLTAWLIMFVYLCLMGAEFFCGEWLEKRLTLYAFSHMLIMPLIVYWLAQMAVPGIGLTDGLMVMMVLAFVSGFCFEITRKTRGPEEERDTVDSYSRIFGTKGSAYVVIGLITGMLVTQIALVHVLSVVPAWPYWLAMALMYLVSVKQIVSFIKAPSLKGREKNEAAVAINMLVGYLVIIIAVLVQNGADWSLF